MATSSWFTQTNLRRNYAEPRAHIKTGKIFPRKRDFKALKKLSSLNPNIASMLNYFSGKASRKDKFLVAGIVALILGASIAYYLTPKPPSIENVAVDKSYVEPGQTFEVKAKITDQPSLNSGIKNVTASALYPNGTIASFPMKEEAGIYKSEIKATIPGEFKINVTTFDKENFKVEKAGLRVTSGIEEEQRNEFISKGGSENFLDKTDFGWKILKKIGVEKTLPISKLHEMNGTLVKELYDVVLQDERVPTALKEEIFSDSSSMLVDAGVKSLSGAQLNIPEKLSLAYRYGYPRHNRTVLLLYIYAIGKNPDLVDFTPIFFKGIDGDNISLVPVCYREHWATAELLKRIKESGFDVEDHPEMFEGINCKVIANFWSLFDAKYGIAYAEKEKSGRIIKPNDSDVWDLIMLQWSLYSNKAPQLNGSEKLYNRDFPWYNSTQLKQLYPDKNTRRQALFFLFSYIPNTTFDIEKGERVVGVEGAKLSLIQPEKEYETICKLYPNGTVPTRFLGDQNPKYFFYGWLGDRRNHGLKNTVDEFTGYFDVSPGCDEYLTKNWKYWDLVKFIAGYERWNVGNYPPASEIEGINYFIPQTLRAFGFPVYWITQDHSPPGAIGYEWAVSLPQYVVDNMKKEFEDKIVVGPANLFGLYACKEGLIKDGATEILIALPAPKNSPYEDVRIYLMKKS
jgi:hypothetical protein